MNLEQFLNEFYEVISFEHNEPFKSEQFMNLFVKDALLIEKYEDKYIHKTIDEHMNEFEEVIKKHPELFIKGFHEIQLDYEALQTQEYILVKSKYKKSYASMEEEIIEVGYNCMTIVREQDEFKIASIGW